jgi:hypothetical protein
LTPHFSNDDSVHRNAKSIGYDIDAY